MIYYQTFKSQIYWYTHLIIALIEYIILQYYLVLRMIQYIRESKTRHDLPVPCRACAVPHPGSQWIGHDTGDESYLGLINVMGYQL